MVDLDKLQQEVYQNKINKGFNVTDNKENIFRQFCLLQGELAEAFEAYNKNLDTLGEELADVCIYLLGLCQIKGISLEKEVLKKVEINKNRSYKNVNGVWLKEKLN